MRARAIVCTARDQVEVRDVAIPAPGPREVLVESLFTCISPGTELRCVRGKQADTAFPFIPGYAVVGRIAQVGPEVDLRIGTVVFTHGTTRVEGAVPMWGGHCSHVLVPSHEALPLPPGVDPLEATLVKLGAIAYHGMRLSHPRPGEHVAVVGLGPIGQLAALMHQLAGARVIGCDRMPERLEVARRLGIDVVDGSAGLPSAFAAVFPHGADIVVDASGAPKVLEEAVTLARALPWGDDHVVGARYLVQGSYETAFSIPYQPAFMRELTFLIPRDTVPRDRREVLALLAAKKLSLRTMISDVRPPEEAARTYADLGGKDPRLVTVAFQWAT